MLSRRATVLLVVALSITPILSSLRPATMSPGPKTTVNAPPANGTLYDFWNGNAYFDRQTYNVQGWSSSNPVHEVAPVLKDGDSNTIYLYYRSYNDSNGHALTGGRAGIGLEISTDGGATFSFYNHGWAVVNPGSGCDSDSMYAVAPSVVVVNHVYYMVYEGRSNGIFCSYISPGDIDLAISSDGKSWTKLGTLIY